MRFSLIFIIIIVVISVVFVAFFMVYKNMGMQFNANEENGSNYSNTGILEKARKHPTRYFFEVGVGCLLFCIFSFLIDIITIPLMVALLGRGGAVWGYLIGSVVSIILSSICLSRDDSKSLIIRTLLCPIVIIILFFASCSLPIMSCFLIFSPLSWIIVDCLIRLMKFLFDK